MKAPLLHPSLRTRSICRGVAAVLGIVVAAAVLTSAAKAAELRAGVARADITDRRVERVNDPLYAKALVLQCGDTTIVLITIDAVAIGELGRIGNDFLPHVRAELQKELGIPPAAVVINASHCHGLVCAEVESRTIQAVQEAWRGMVPVRVGAGAGREDRIMENRRLKLKDGSEADARRAYALPPDEEVTGIGPTDPQIGLLRLDRQDGKCLAVVYNFACHPIEGVPGGGNSADMIGFASKVIEDGLGDGAVALFVQGCAGDINPIGYKSVQVPHDAEPLGNLLGLSALRALKGLPTGETGKLKIVNEILPLPRGTDLQRRIEAIQVEQARLVQSLKGTDLNLKSFVPLFVQHGLSGEFPADYPHRYLHDQSTNRDHLVRHDAANRANLETYVRNIHVMEQLTRLQENMNLLKKHEARNLAAGGTPVDAEIVGLRVGDFVLVTFPGEPSVDVGLEIKRHAPSPLTFVAGYTNGFLYYAPTAKQRNNTGYAQEDCDCLLAPEWQKLFQGKAQALLKEL